MATPLKIVAFGALVIGVFIWFASYFTELSGGAGFAAASGDISPEAGEAIFWGKGKCSTCHSIGPEGSAVRGPNLGVVAGQFDEPIGVRAASRKPGASAVEYLVESLYDPNAFITPGFPKGVMTPMNRPPISLNDEEIRSAVLYLLMKSAVDADAQMVRSIERVQRNYARIEVADDQAIGLALPKGYKSAGKKAFEHFKCRLCHVVRGIEWEQQLAGGIGPELTGIGAIQSEAYLFESIINPNAVILPDPSPTKKYTEGGKSRMPEWGYVMTVQQVADIVAFLETLTEPPPDEPPPEPLPGGLPPGALPVFEPPPGALPEDMPEPAAPAAPAPDGGQ